MEIANLITTASHNFTATSNNSSTLSLSVESKPATSPPGHVTQQDKPIWKKTALNITSDSLSPFSFSHTESPTPSPEVAGHENRFGTYVSIYEDQYSTPVWIFILNFFLVVVLMVVISIAVYPAVKKYCDSTFFSNDLDSSRYWIEDNDEIVSVLTSNIPECSFALIKQKQELFKPTEAMDDSSSSGSIDIFNEAQSELTRLTHYPSQS